MCHMEQLIIRWVDLYVSYETTNHWVGGCVCVTWNNGLLGWCIFLSYLEQLMIGCGVFVCSTLENDHRALCVCMSHLE